MNYELSARQLLKKQNLRPHKGLGQNFLSDPFHLGQIVEAVELSPDDTVLEIGPGTGTLTRLLMDVARCVVAVELDPKMVNILQAEFAHKDNLTIIQADILQTELEDIISSKQKYKVAANLPYYITSAVIRHLLETPTRPERIVVTVQKEVAQRITAKPGKMSLLAVSVQLYGRAEIVHHIPANAFYPPPKVDSAVVRIDSFPHPAVEIYDVKQFFQVVKAGFSQKRKQLKNSISATLAKPAAEMASIMEQASINPTRRAETLTLAEWGRLAEEIRCKWKPEQP